LEIGSSPESEVWVTDNHTDRDDDSATDVIVKQEKQTIKSETQAALDPNTCATANHSCNGGDDESNPDGGAKRKQPTIKSETQASPM